MGDLALSILVVEREGLQPLQQGLRGVRHEVVADHLVDVQDEGESRRIDDHVDQGGGLHQERGAALGGHLVQEHLGDHDEGEGEDLPVQRHAGDLQLDEVELLLVEDLLRVVFVRRPLRVLVDDPRLGVRRHVPQEPAQAPGAHQILVHRHYEQENAEHAAPPTLDAVLARVHQVVDLGRVLREDAEEGVAREGPQGPEVPVVQSGGREDGPRGPHAVGAVGTRIQVQAVVAQEHLPGEAVPDELLLGDVVEDEPLNQEVHHQEEPAPEARRHQHAGPACALGDWRQATCRAVD
mmetsp:Transcript_2045/g.5768  ORF Transcript_2045/g.5768 Transcript_2045/m.5768 type:complete len:294 (+) Transcript_2045:374-1255(+)